MQPRTHHQQHRTKARKWRSPRRSQRKTRRASPRTLNNKPATNHLSLSYLQFHPLPTSSLPQTLPSLTMALPFILLSTSTMPSATIPAPVNSTPLLSTPRNQLPCSQSQFQSEFSRRIHHLVENKQSSILHQQFSTNWQPQVINLLY